MHGLYALRSALPRRCNREIAMKNINCLLCGVGGQGTVLASKLLAFAAMQKGLDVRTSETIGMAQRGGCVVSHVRMGQDIASPMVPKQSAQVVIGFEPGEAVRCLDYLAEDGFVITNSKGVMPITANFGGAKYEPGEMIEYLKANVKNLIIVDGDDICKQCGSTKVLNIALLAAAAKTGRLGITVDELKSAIVMRMPEKFHAINLKAVEIAASK